MTRKLNDIVKFVKFEPRTIPTSGFRPTDLELLTDRTRPIYYQAVLTFLPPSLEGDEVLQEVSSPPGVRRLDRKSIRRAEVGGLEASAGPQPGRGKTLESRSWARIGEAPPVRRPFGPKVRPKFLPAALGGAGGLRGAFRCSLSRAGEWKGGTAASRFRWKVGPASNGGPATTGGTKKDQNSYFPLQPARVEFETIQNLQKRETVIKIPLPPKKK